MRVKHNKKRNTAFLYESLITELTKAIVRGQEDKKQNILETIKKYFNAGSPLKRELEIYKSVLEADKMSPNLSQRFLFEVKKDFNNLDKKEIFNQQTALIKEINESYSNAVFSNFISNYKNIGSLYQYFNSEGANAKTRLILEQRVVGMLTSTKTEEKQEMKHIDSLEYKTFVNKFNENEDLGTDFYDSEMKKVKTLPYRDNYGYFFSSGPNTWHGMEKKEIIKERRCLQVNYVTFKTDWKVED